MAHETGAHIGTDETLDRSRAERADAVPLPVQGAWGKEDGMTRYDHDYSQSVSFMYECADGRYVRFNEHEKATAEQRQEIGRLTKCLEQANKNHEEFERKWSLATEEIERLQDALVEERDQ